MTINSNIVCVRSSSRSRGRSSSSSSRTAYPFCTQRLPGNFFNRVRIRRAVDWIRKKRNACIKFTPGSVDHRRWNAALIERFQRALISRFISCDTERRAARSTEFPRVPCTVFPVALGSNVRRSDYLQIATWVCTVFLRFFPPSLSISPPRHGNTISPGVRANLVAGSGVYWIRDFLCSALWCSWCFV